MRNLAGAALGWLRRRLQRRHARVPAGDVGARPLVRVGQALAWVESLTSEGITHRPMSASAASVAGRLEGDVGGVLNAFGRPISETIGGDASGALAVATGMALTGLRAATWVAGDELAGARDGLADAADRLAPLVVHVSDGPRAHAGCHALSASPVFQILAVDGQQALDLTLVARRVAERTLVPGIVVSSVDAIAPLTLPDAALVRDWLGSPQDLIRSPTEAQRVLFGESRRQVLPWFDADHPVATASVRGPADAAQARRAREVFFWDHVAEVAAEAMDSLSQRTGRALDFVHPYRFDDAEIVLIALGADAQTARAAADSLARQGVRVGVIGISWLRPFPAAAIEALLATRRKPATVVVVERVDGPVTGDPPLLATLRGVLDPALTRNWLSAFGSRLDHARLVALCRAVKEGAHPSRVRLESARLDETGFPRRDALLTSVRLAYPALGAARLPGDGPAAPDAGDLPDDTLAIGLAAHEAVVGPDALTRLAESLRELVGGGVVRGAIDRPQPLAWFARVQAAPTDFADPGVNGPIDGLVLLLDDPGDLGNPLEALVEGGTLWITMQRPSPEVWWTLPPAWRRLVARRRLSVMLVSGGLTQGLDALGAWVNAEAGDAVRLDWQALGEAPVSEAPLAPILRHIAQSRPAHDSLPRFWGTVGAPRAEGLQDLAGLEPLSAAGAVPACASALQRDPVGAPSLPSLDPSACTACGRCWTACPDSALGATLIGIEALLTAASKLAGTRGLPAELVRRNHRHLATRLAKRLETSGNTALDRTLLDEAGTWLLDRLGVAAEREAHQEALDKTARIIERLAPVASDAFFREPEAHARSSGEVFILAMDPRACQGCATCVAVCPEGALTPGERSGPAVEAARERWRLWEALPDTPGESIARAAADPRVGPLAGALLSRHVSLAQAGGGVSEPGSGERLAVRVVTAVVEEHAQRRSAELVDRLEEARQRLETQTRELLTGSLAQVDFDALSEALEAIESSDTQVSQLVAGLEAQGHRAPVDRDALRRVSDTAEELDSHVQRFRTGADGLGRARFGLVFARGMLSEWAGRFPRHPYFAPTTVEPTNRGVELARGIIRGVMAEHLDIVRSLRRAHVLADAAGDREDRLAEIDRLRWEDLSEAERAGCPPLLFVGDATSIGDMGLGWLTRLMTSSLPIKVVMLDGRDRLKRRTEPALVAMAHRSAFVSSSSIAYGDHLASGLKDALAYDGPALVHIHAPSPRRQGYPADESIAVARLAVHARAHILFRYDPASEGVFGRRASLAGNPSPDAPWGEVDFVTWAAGLECFAEHLTPAEGEAGVDVTTLLEMAEREQGGQLGVLEHQGQRWVVGRTLLAAARHRLGVWQTLREVTGEAETFTDSIRARVSSELADQHNAALQALRAGHEEQLAGMDAAVAERLTQRLLELAGYGRGHS